MMYNKNAVDVYTVIVHNGNEVATLYHGHGGGGWEQESQTMIVQANQGDEI